MAKIKKPMFRKGVLAERAVRDGTGQRPQRVRRAGLSSPNGRAHLRLRAVLRISDQITDSRAHLRDVLLES
jgi:hypothetical protein